MDRFWLPYFVSNDVMYIVFLSEGKAIFAEVSSSGSDSSGVVEAILGDFCFVYGSVSAGSPRRLTRGSGFANETTDPVFFLWLLSFSL